MTKDPSSQQQQQEKLKREWLHGQVTPKRIQNILSKINDESWVIDQCIHRTAIDSQSMRELIQHGISLIEDRHSTIIQDLKTRLKNNNNNNKKKPKEEIVDVSEKQWQLMNKRQQLYILKSRLDTYMEMREDNAFIEPEFVQLRDAHLVQYAKEKALNREFHALTAILMNHLSDQFKQPFMISQSEALDILSCVPGTTSPDLYSHLLPLIVSGEDGNDDYEGRVVFFDEEFSDDRGGSGNWGRTSDDSIVYDYDWSDRSEINNQGENKVTMFAKCVRLTEQQVRDWYKTRAIQIEEQCGFADNSLRLIDIAMRDKGVSGLEDFRTTMYFFNVIVYECENDCITLDSYLNQLSDYEKFVMLMQVVEYVPDDENSADLFVDHLMRVGLLFIEQNETARRPLLYQFMREKLAKNNMQIIEKIVKQSKQHHGTKKNRIIKSDQDLMNVALDCIYASNQADAWDSLINVLEEATEGVESNSKLLALRQCLFVGEILSKYGEYLNVRDVESLRSNASQLETIVKKLIQKTKKNNFENADFDELLEDILFLIKFSPSMSVVDILSMYLIYRCNAGYSIPFDELTACDMLSYEQIDATLYTLLEALISCSKSPRDKSLNQAKQCVSLHKRLIKSFKTNVTRERRWEIDANILEAYNILLSHFPKTTELAKLREMLDKGQEEEFVQTILMENHSERAYTKLNNLLQISNLVGFNSKHHQLEVKRLVAEVALRESDFSFALNVAQSLIQSNHASSYHLAHQLATNNEIEITNRERNNLLLFVLDHCPCELITEVIEAQRQFDVSIDLEQEDMDTLSIENSSESSISVTHMRDALLQRNTSLFLLYGTYLASLGHIEYIDSCLQSVVQDNEGRMDLLDIVRDISCLFSLLVLREGASSTDEMLLAKNLVQMTADQIIEQVMLMQATNQPIDESLMSRLKYYSNVMQSQASRGNKQKIRELLESGESDAASLLLVNLPTAELPYFAELAIGDSDSSSSDMRLFLIDEVLRLIALHNIDYETSKMRYEKYRLRTTKLFHQRHDTDRDIWISYINGSIDLISAIAQSILLNNSVDTINKRLSTLREEYTRAFQGSVSKDAPVALLESNLANAISTITQEVLNGLDNVSESIDIVEDAFPSAHIEDHHVSWPPSSWIQAKRCLCMILSASDVSDDKELFEVPLELCDKFGLDEEKGLNARIVVLRIIEKFKPLTTMVRSLLQRYETSQHLQEAFTSLSRSYLVVNSTLDEQWKSDFEELLAKAETEKQFECLSAIIRIWKKDADEEALAPLQYCLKLLLHAIVNNNPNLLLDISIEHFSILTLEIDEYIYKELQEAKLSLLACRYAIQSSHKPVQEQGLQYAKTNQSQVAEWLTSEHRNYNDFVNNCIMNGYAISISESPTIIRHILDGKVHFTSDECECQFVAELCLHFAKENVVPSKRYCLLYAGEYVARRVYGIPHTLTTLSNCIVLIKDYLNLQVVCMRRKESDFNAHKSRTFAYHIDEVKFCRQLSLAALKTLTASMNHQ